MEMDGGIKMRIGRLLLLAVCVFVILQMQHESKEQNYITVEAVDATASLSFEGQDIETSQDGSQKILKQFDSMTDGYQQSEAKVIANKRSVQVKNIGAADITLKPHCSVNGSGELYTYAINDSAIGEDGHVLKPGDGNAVTITIMPKSGIAEKEYTNAKICFREGIESTDYILSNLSIIKKAEVKDTDANKTRTVVSGTSITLAPSITGYQPTSSYQWFSKTKESDNPGTPLTESKPVSDSDKGAYTYTAKTTDAPYIMVRVRDEWGSVTDLTYHITVTEKAKTYGLAFSQSKYEFAKVIEGYEQVPSAVTVKLTNQGTGSYTGLSVKTEATGTIKTSCIEISTTNVTTLASGQSIQVIITPNKNLAKGTYTDTLKATAKREDGTEDTATMTCTFVVQEKVEKLTLSVSSVDFGTTTEGYTKLPTGKTITVKNSGNVKIKVSKPTVSQFTVTEFDNDKELDAGNSFSFTIVPKTGLTAGSYKESILVSSSVASATLTCQFVVNKAPAVTISGTTSIEEGMSTTLTCSATGGTTPYSYKWNESGTSSSLTVKPKTTKEYIVTVTDKAGITCTASITVYVEPKLKVSILGPNYAEKGKSIVLRAEVTDGKSPYQYTWSTGEKTSTIEVSLEENTTYSVTVTDGFEISEKATKSVSVMKATTEEQEEIMKIHKTEYDFGSSREGYQAAAMKQEVKVINCGKSAFTVILPKSTVFEFEGFIDTHVVEAGRSFSFAVYPKENLVTGDYTDTIVIQTVEGYEQRISLAFSVMAKVESLEQIPREKVSTTKEYPFGDGAVTIRMNEAEMGFLVVENVADCISAVLSQTELEQVEQGKHVEIKIHADQDMGHIAEEERQLVEDAVYYFQMEYPELILGKYFDLSIQKKFDEDEWVPVTETMNEIQMSIQIPEELEEKGSTYYLLRNHDGVCQRIASWNEKGQMWDFSSDRFSTFAIVYLKKGEQKGTNLAGKNEQMHGLGRKRKGWIFSTYALCMVLILILYEIFFWKWKKWNDKFKIITPVIITIVMIFLSILGNSKTDLFTMIVCCATLIATSLIQFAFEELVGTS